MCSFWLVRERNVCQATSSGRTPIFMLSCYVAASQCKAAGVEAYRKAGRSIVVCLHCSNEVDALLLRNFSLAEMDKATVQCGGNTELEKARKFHAVRGGLRAHLGRAPVKAEMFKELGKIVVSDPRHKYNSDKKLNVLRKAADCCIEHVEVDKCLQLMEHRQGDKLLVNSLYSLEARTLIPEKEYICQVLRCLSIMLKRGAIESPQCLSVNALKGAREPGLCVYLYAKNKLWKKLMDEWKDDISPQ